MFRGVECAKKEKERKKKKYLVIQLRREEVILEKWRFWWVGSFSHRKVPCERVHVSVYGGAENRG